MISIFGYLDAGTGSVIIVVTAFAFGILPAGWIMNIIGAVRASNRGNAAQVRFVFHIIGAVLFPLGIVMGWVWLIAWRRSDRQFAMATAPQWSPPQ